MQVYFSCYGLVLYIILMLDSNFWRRLEMLANGPFPAFRSLDDIYTGRVRCFIHGCYEG